MEPKVSDGLTIKEAEFARLVACGHTQTDAIALVSNLKRAKPETIRNMGCKFMARPHVKARVRELLKAARIEDILTVGQHVRDILDHRNAAFADGNHTAVAAHDKTLAQILGMTSLRVVVDPEKSQSDEDLVASLAQGDEHKARMLRAVMGKDGFA